MIEGFKDLVRRGFERSGYRITRLRPPNRFQAMEATLLLMRTAGFSPRIVIDAGANVGTWTQIARPIFPDAQFHLIEPQAGCVAKIRYLIRSTAGLTLHPVAVTAPGISLVRMAGGGQDGLGSGAWVFTGGEEIDGDDEREYPATTLDDLLADSVTLADRCLLKLDLEGHESCALSGAERLLQSVEAVLMEVQFYDINRLGRPIFSDMSNFLRIRGFEFYDFAALSPRTRDLRLRHGDAVFVRSNSPLLSDDGWA